MLGRIFGWNKVDVMPSTYDVVRASSFARAVVTCLKTAESRVLTGHSFSTYISESGAVCALGGVLVADGVTKSQLPSMSCGEGTGSDLFKYLEAESIISDVAKEAIVLLNRAADEVYPDETLYGTMRVTKRDLWQGKLEQINQAVQLSSYKRHEMILKCYARAIEIAKALEAEQNHGEEVKPVDPVVPSEEVVTV